MRFLLPGVILLVLSACLDEPDCIVTATNLVKISLRKINVDSANTVAFSKITVTGTDTLFYKNKKASSLSLPVNPGTTKITIKFYYGASIDSLTLGYSLRRVIISPDCGAFVYFENLGVLSTSFTSIKVNNSQLSTSATNNLEIKL